MSENYKKALIGMIENANERQLRLILYYVTALLGLK